MTFLQTITSVIFAICVLGVIITLSFFVLEQMGDVEIPRMYCEDSGGKWMFYECCNTLGNCNEVNKTGYWCDYSDGSSMSKDRIWEIFNTTT